MFERFKQLLYVENSEQFCHCGSTFDSVHLDVHIIMSDTGLNARSLLVTTTNPAPDVTNRRCAERRVSLQSGQSQIRDNHSKSTESKETSTAPAIHQHQLPCLHTPCTHRRHGRDLHRLSADQRERRPSLQGRPGGEWHPGHGEAEHEEGRVDRRDKGACSITQRAAPTSLSFLLLSLAKKKFCRSGKKEEASSAKSGSSIVLRTLQK